MTRSFEYHENPPQLPLLPGQDAGAGSTERRAGSRHRAPTGMGRQSRWLSAYQNKADRDTLSKMNAAVMGGNGDPFYGAPCVAVVLVDKTIPTCVEDGSLVMGNMLNAAESVGLSACWIHRAKEMFETAEGQALLKKWGVPNAENLRGVGNCILGYAAEGGKKAPAPRKENYVVLVK